MDRWDESVWGEEEVAEERPFSHERLLFLIDASPAMLEPCTLEEKGVEDKEFEGKSWVEAAVLVAASICRQKVIAGSGDEVGVVLYNTDKASRHEQHGEFLNTWVLLDLAQPGAQAIADLEAFSLKSFRANIGSLQASGAGAGPGGREGAVDQRGLTSAFWLAKTLLASKGEASRRILLFTRCAEPLRIISKGTDTTQDWRNLRSRIATLRNAATALELYPMVGPGEAFDVQPFWRKVLLELRGLSDVEADALEEREQVCHIQSLVTLVRSKAHKRRAVGSFKWQLGGGLDCGVKLYQILQAQKEGARLKVHGLNNAEVRSVTTGYIDAYSGAHVAQPDKPTAKDKKDAATQGVQLPTQEEALGLRTYYPSPRLHAASRLPKTYVSQQELKALKGMGQPGLTLLGFKPRSALKEYHQVRNPSFLYPDEKAQAGSATAFIAVHRAMLESDTMAICRLAANNARQPRLVALLPQDELVNEDEWQLEPPGMQVVYLPFADDIRRPEREASFTGGAAPAASEEAVAAAEALVAQMALGDDFHPAAVIKNPVLQRYYQVLEAKAAGVEPPPLEEMVDDTLPYLETAEDEELVAQVAAVVQAFKEACHVGEDSPKKGATKRKAAEPADAAALDSLDVEGRAAAGTLAKLTVDQLKAWLRAKGLKVGGSKGDLVERINLHLHI